jgi:hypothetical protein
VLVTTLWLRYARVERSMEDPMEMGTSYGYNLL